MMPSTPTPPYQPEPLPSSRPGPPRRRPDTRVSPLNIVPFMDMSFTLLLFLCLAASFALGEGVLTTNLPRVDDTDRSEEDFNLPLMVSVTGVGDNARRIELVGFQESPPDFVSLTEKLRKLLATNGGYYPDTTQVVIKPAGDVRWQHVVNAFNAVVKARYKNIAFAQTE